MDHRQQKKKDQKKEAADLNYWEKARSFAAMSLKYCAKFPPGFRYGLTDHLADEARQAYVLATQANRVYINTKALPETLIAQYRERGRLLKGILEALGAFDADFSLLMEAVDIEADTLGRLRTILGPFFPLRFFVCPMNAKGPALPFCQGLRVQYPVPVGLPETT